MQGVADIVGAVAWPLTALVLALLLVRELKNGLIIKILPNGGSIEAAGFKVQTNEAKATVRRAHLVVDDNEIDPSAELSPYDQVMDAWRKLAAAVTSKAVQYGGIDDQRRVNTNLELLAAKGIYRPEVVHGVGQLFQARNSARKLGADSMAEADASSFVATANALLPVFK